MELNELKLTMITEYEKQLSKLFNKLNQNEISSKDFINHFNYLNHRQTFTRVDIKNQGDSSNDIEFLEYGKNINMYKPDWLKDELGIGSKLEWNYENTKFIFKCINSGNLNVILRGIDYRDIDGLRIPIYTNFTKFTINNRVIFDENCLVWHDEAYIFEKECENQQYFQIGLKFKTLFDYFPQLCLKIAEDTGENRINQIYENITQYITMEKSFMKKNF